MKRSALMLVLLYAAFNQAAPHVVLAATVVDAAGRMVTIPGVIIRRMVPAGARVAVLLAVIVPGRMLGLPGPPGAAGRAALAPAVSA